MTVLTPVEARPRSGERIHSLDLARGVAILGTLATNIWLFSHVGGFAGYLDQSVTPGTPAPLALLQQLLMTLSNGKFLGLLTLMFGIGLEIQRRSTLRAGRRWPGSYLWRAGLLFVDGVVNFILVIEFDVLMGYAMTGALVAHLMLTSARGQRIWIWVAGTVHVLMITALSGLLLATEGLGGTSGVTDPGTQSPYALGSFLDLVLFRIDNLVLFRLEPVLIFALSVAMFLIGAKLFRAGIFATDGAALRRRLMVAGLAIVWPIDLLVGAFGGTGGFLFDRYVLAPVVALGLLALIAHIGLHTSPTAWFSLRLQELGRMALTGYIGQNVIASILFYGWGFGLAAQLGTWRVQGTLVAFVVISALVLMFAHLWLRRFGHGPVEWLWRESFHILSGTGPTTPPPVRPDRPGER